MTNIDRNQGELPRDEKKPHPRPISAFLPSDGRPVTVAEALCLLVHSMIPHIKTEGSLPLGPEDGDKRDVTGAELVSTVLHLLSSGENRSLMNRLVLPRLMPEIEDAVLRLGYAHAMVTDENEAEE